MENSDQPLKENEAINQTQSSDKQNLANEELNVQVKDEQSNHESSAEENKEELKQPLEEAIEENEEVKQIQSSDMQNINLENAELNIQVKDEQSNYENSAEKDKEEELKQPSEQALKENEEINQAQSADMQNINLANEELNAQSKTEQPKNENSAKEDVKESKEPTKAQIKCFAEQKTIETIVSAIIVSIIYGHLLLLIISPEDYCYKEAPSSHESEFSLDPYKIFNSIYLYFT